LQTILLAAFAALALLLAMAGAYGVLSYSVTERTREFGVRLAIGAHRRDVLYLVLGRAARLAGLGICVGVVASAALSRLMTSLLYGVMPTDTWTYGAVALILFLVSMLAAYLPALRATRVDPVVALRYD
jgi:ABC-type antimicrobial peptide transport system permease subunit